MHNERDEEIRRAAAALIMRLEEKKMTLSAAESCTGGWFAKAIVDLEGASRVFYGGVVSYVNAVKEKLLGVPAKDLLQYTAVSAPVAIAMAEGVRNLLATDIAVSVTGLAGPDGGTPQIPVGRVYIGVSAKEGNWVRTLDLAGDRKQVREQAVLHMIEELLKTLS